MGPKQQFLKDLQSDKDYIRHRQECRWNELKFYKHSGLVAVSAGSYHPVSVDNDTYKKEVDYEQDDIG